VKDGEPFCLTVERAPPETSNLTNLYATSPAVPTWNYAAVHVYGKPAASEERDFAKAALVDLGAKYESARIKPSREEDLAPDVFDRLASAVVAFEMPVERIEGRFKLG
jgi:transcriptional regulator